MPEETKFQEFVVTMRVKVIATDDDEGADTDDKVETEEVHTAVSYVMGEAEADPHTMLAGSGCFLRFGETEIVSVHEAEPVL